MSLDLDITYIFVLALFLLPLLILNGIVIGPFLRLFEERHERLEGAIARAESMLEEAERSAATFEARIRDAAREGSTLRSKLRAEAVVAMNEKVSAERSSVQARLEEAVQRIHSERDTAMSGVATEAERVAEQMANKMLGRTVA